MLIKHRFVFSFAVIALLPCAGLAAPGQPLLIDPGAAASPVEPGSPPAAAPPAPSVADRRAQNADQLRIAMRKLETNGTTDSAAAQEVAYYQTREAVLAQQEAVEQQVKDLESREAELTTFLTAPPNNNKTYTFADLDRLKDDLAGEQARAAILSDKLATAGANVDKAKAALEASDVKSRQAQGEYESGKNGPNATALAAAADRAQHEATLASETLTLRKREVEREQLAKDVQKLSITVRQNLVARVSPKVTFTQTDYQDEINDIKAKTDAATQAQSMAQVSFHNVNVDLQATQGQLDAKTGDRAVLIEQRNAERVARDRWSEEIDSQAQRLQQLAQLRVAWDRRYQIATTKQSDADHDAYKKLKSAQDDTKHVLDQLATDVRTQILKMRDVRDKLTSVAKRIDGATKVPPDVLRELNNQQEQLEATLRIHESNLMTIETSRRVHEKLLDEVGFTVDALTPKAIAMGAWYQVEAVWNHELLPINGQSVRIGDAIKGLAILIIGWMLSRSTAGIFANRLLKRFRLSKDATSAIRSLVFYSLLLSVALTALDTVGVPLTAFTILGGGLAIGVGFGSQTLVNNFIGGLIMLAERPVRLGERITFGSIDGVVEDVGFRCTKLRTPTDHLVTIPNSTLVNESIENIDRRRTIRRTITIAVSYNISQRLLTETVQAIRDLLEERDIRERIHPIIGFEEFLPQVFFSDFAAESLNIQVTYWYAPVDSRAFMEHAERVNFRIMEEFDRLGVDFAFPSKTAFVNNRKRLGGGQSNGADSYAA